MSEACNFIKKETLAQVFSCETCEISQNTFSYRTATVAASDTKRLIPKSDTFDAVIVKLDTKIMTAT